MPIRSRIREIATLRARLGLSQHELGRKLGVDQATISRWERDVQIPEPRIRIRLSELVYRLDVSRGLGPEISLVEHSPFPMAIISKDWSIVALSDAIVLRAGVAQRERLLRGEKKLATADMEQAVSLLRAQGFFDGKIAVAKIVARGFLLGHGQEPFEAICTPVTIDGEICRLMQYVFLSETEFVERRRTSELLTIVSHNADERLP
jgi:transcriptional regulator with XRE-family HTH domain